MKPDIHIITATDKTWVNQQQAVNYHQLANFIVLWAPKYFKSHPAGEILLFADTWEPKLHRLLEDVMNQSLPAAFNCKAQASFVQKVDNIPPPADYIIYLGIPPGAEHLKHAASQSKKVIIITYQGDAYRMHAMINFNFKGFQRDLVMINNIWSGNDPVKNISETYGLAGYFQYLDYNVSYTFELSAQRDNDSLIDQIIDIFLGGDTLLCRLKIILQSGGELDISLDRRIFQKAVSMAARSSRSDDDFLTELNRYYTELQREKDQQAQVFYHDYLISFQFPPFRQKRETLRELIHSLRWQEDTERLLFILKRMGLADRTSKTPQGDYIVHFSKKHNQFYIDRLSNLAYELLPPYQAKLHLLQYQIDEESLLAEQFFACFIELMYHIEVPHFTRQLNECRDWVYHAMNFPDKPRLATLKNILSQRFVPFLRSIVKGTCEVKTCIVVLEQIITRLQGEKNYHSSLNHMASSLKAMMGHSHDEPAILISRGLCELAIHTNIRGDEFKIGDLQGFEKAKRVLLEGLEILLHKDENQMIESLNLLDEVENRIQFFGNHIAKAWIEALRLVYWRSVNRTSQALLAKLNRPQDATIV